MTGRVESFVVDVGQARLDGLAARLRATEFPGVVGDDSWDLGVPVGYLRELVGYWRDEYDWRAREAELNELAHFRTTIDGLPIHFVHERGRGPRPVPLVLSHGWPWTFWDFARLIALLTDPAAHGGDEADAFDVVVPSLPGFVFSSPLPRGVTVTEAAALWVTLMRDVLGYDRFGAQGGDWGALITGQLGHAHAEHLVGIHCSMPNLPGIDWRALQAEDYEPGERHWFEHMQRRLPHARSHLTVHTHDPQTLAAALHDSPAGLAAWLVERRRNWSDCDGDVERRFSKDELLTSVMLYWATGTIGSSMRFYWENRARRWAPAHDRTPAIEAPTAIAVLPQELIVEPRSIIARHADLRRWTELPRGGHFGQAEEPELLADDIRAFFRPLRAA